MPVLWPLAFLLASCAPPADTGEDSASHTSSLQKVPADVWSRVDAGEPVVVLVQLREGDLTGQLAGLSRRERRVRRAQVYGERMDAVLGDLPLRGAHLLRRYQHVPMLPMEVADVAVLEALEEDERVEWVFAEEYHEAFLTQSLALIDQPTAAADGFTGAGTSVAILDTGLDYTRAAFGSCTAPNTGAGCKVVYAADFATSDGARDTGSYHGTNVAGIVAGVAPDADLIGLDVFSGTTASSTDIIAAIDWAIDNVDTYNIASLNLSLGGGTYTAACTTSPYSTAFDNARAEGILPVVASGNNAWGNKIASPACDPRAFSVGAVYDSNVGGMAWSGCTDATTAADRVTCFSNSISFLDILAPGAMIEAAGITMGGTSQATPHVAGAVAVLRAAFPSDTADQIQSRLTSTGVPVTDHRQGRVTPRLDLPAALEGAESGGGSAPTGTITINSGATVAASSALSLSLSSDTATEMCISELTSPACSAWETYATSKTYTLSGTSRNVTLYATFRNTSGTSSVVSDDILYDISLPSDGTLQATPGAGSLAVSWSGFSDAHSGLASYKLVYLTGSTNPAAACSNGTTAYTGTATSTTLSGLTGGTTYRLRVCAIDNADNTSSGATATGTPTSSGDGGGGGGGDVGTPGVMINDGAELTGNRKVTLTLSASAATHMCISNSTRCSTWQAYTTTKGWNLSAGSGTRTVRVWFKDADGTISSPVSDTISLDTTKPGNGVFTGEGADASLHVGWSGFSDGHSGVASYKLVYSTGSKAPNTGCTSGTVGYEGSEDSTTLTGMTNGTTYNLRLCAIDNAGNTSTGTTLALRAAPEFNAPTGSVIINSGDEWTGSRSVSLTISGTDDTDIAGMCISNSTKCSTWQTFAEGKTWSVTSGTGTKTVRVWLRDSYNNVSEIISDTISLDMTRPSNGTLSGIASGSQIALTWSGAADTHTGVASYKLVYRTGSSKPASTCSSGTVLYEGTDSAAVHTGVSSGTAYNYRLCTIDTVGNISTGAAVSVTP